MATWDSKLFFDDRDLCDQRRHCLADLSKTTDSVVNQGHGHVSANLTATDTCLSSRNLAGDNSMGTWKTKLFDQMTPLPIYSPASHVTSAADRVDASTCSVAFRGPCVAVPTIPELFPNATTGNARAITSRRGTRPVLCVDAPEFTPKCSQRLGQYAKHDVIDDQTAAVECDDVNRTATCNSISITENDRLDRTQLTGSQLRKHRTLFERSGTLYEKHMAGSNIDEVFNDDTPLAATHPTHTATSFKRHLVTEDTVHGYLTPMAPSFVTSPTDADIQANEPDTQLENLCRLMTYNTMLNSSLLASPSPAHSRVTSSSHGQSSVPPTHLSSPAVLLHSDSPSTSQYWISMRESRGGARLCTFCKRNGERRAIFTSHALKDELGHVTCPILRRYTCPICGASGDGAHTVSYCPLGKGISTVMANKTNRKSCGCIRNCRHGVANHH